MGGFYQGSTRQKLFFFGGLNDRGPIDSYVWILDRELVEVFGKNLKGWPYERRYVSGGWALKFQNSKAIPSYSSFYLCFSGSRCEPSAIAPVWHPCLPDTPCHGGPWLCPSGARNPKFGAFSCKLHRSIPLSQNRNPREASILVKSLYVVSVHTEDVRSSCRDLISPGEM